MRQQHPRARARAYGVAAILVIGLAPAPSDAARNPLVACQKAIDQAAATLFQKAMRTQQQCLQRRDVGKLPPDASCLLHGGSVAEITDARSRKAIITAAAKMRAALQRRCSGIDFFTAPPTGLGFPTECTGIDGACSSALFTHEGVLQCLACTHLAAAHYVVGLQRPTLPYPSTIPTPTPTPTPCTTLIVTVSLSVPEPIGAAYLVVRYPPAAVALPGSGEAVADRVVVLSPGSLVANGQPNDLEDRIAFTLVAASGIDDGDLLTIRFDCLGPVPSPVGFDCMLTDVFAPNGVSPVAGATCSALIGD